MGADRQSRRSLPPGGASAGAAAGAGLDSQPMARNHPNSTLPAATPLAQALAGSEPLARLAQRLQESNARFAAIRDALPATLHAHTRPGPVDEEGWSLLVANPAVAAKLRQLVPRLEDALRAQGWKTLPIRIKVQSA